MQQYKLLKKRKKWLFPFQFRSNFCQSNYKPINHVIKQSSTWESAFSRYWIYKTFSSGSTWNVKQHFFLFLFSSYWKNVEVALFWTPKYRKWKTFSWRFKNSNWMVMKLRGIFIQNSFRQIRSRSFFQYKFCMCNSQTSCMNNELKRGTTKEKSIDELWLR